MAVYINLSILTGNAACPINGGGERNGHCAQSSIVDDPGRESVLSGHTVADPIITGQMLPLEQRAQVLLTFVYLSGQVHWALLDPLCDTFLHAVGTRSTPGQKFENRHGTQAICVTFINLPGSLQTQLLTDPAVAVPVGTVLFVGHAKATAFGPPGQ